VCVDMWLCVGGVVYVLSCVNVCRWRQNIRTKKDLQNIALIPCEKCKVRQKEGMNTSRRDLNLYE